MVTVMLELISKEDEGNLPKDGRLASVERRQRKISRLAEEAREQGGLLTQEDLASIILSKILQINLSKFNLISKNLVVDFLKLSIFY